MMITLLAAAAVTAAACPPRAAPALTAGSGRMLQGDAPRLAVVGARPGDRVRVEARRPDIYGRPVLYRSMATFQADACGRVSLDSAPVEGGWTGSDPRGLLWSMAATRDRPAAGWSPSEVRITADLGADGTVDAATTLRIGPATPLPAAVMLGPGQPGAFFIHPAPGERRPVIVLLGGSEGGDGSARALAPRFVSRGYAVLGLPYYQPPWGDDRIEGLPPAFVDIPLDGLESALAWARARPDVGRVGLYGVSKGAEYVLAAASRLPEIDAVAAIVPSDVIWEGWGLDGAPRSSFSWRGQPLPFVPYQGMTEAIAALQRGEQVALRVPHDRGRAAHPERVAPARIAVERIAAPVLVAGGDRDRVWSSGEMTRAIAATREAAGRRTVALTFPDAGHSLSGSGDAPAAAADARAQAQIFAATLRFFEETLQPPP